MCNEIETKEKAVLPEPVARMWKRAGLPAMIYLGVALGLPLLNGASQKYGSGFWKHALTTCATLAVLVGLLLVLELAWERILARLKER